MENKIYITSLVILVAMFGLFGRVTAQTTENLKPAVERAVISAEKKHRMQSAVVDLIFQWEKAVYLSDMVSRRRPGFKDALIQSKQKATSCRGVLAEGERRVLVPAACLQAADGFSLKGVRLTFSNGKRGKGTEKSVFVYGDLAEIRVSARLTEGLTGVPLGSVPHGQTLAETFGNDILDELLHFFVSRGVVSNRANRITGTENKLQVGDPFFYGGKLVALVQEVPARLPISPSGRIAETSFSLVRDEHKRELLSLR